LGAEGVLGREEAAEAFDQALEGFKIQGVGAAEGIEDVGSGLTGVRVPDVVGHLDVGGGGTILRSHHV